MAIKTLHLGVIFRRHNTGFEFPINQLYIQNQTPGTDKHGGRKSENLVCAGPVGSGRLLDTMCSGADFTGSIHAWEREYSRDLGMTTLSSGHLSEWMLLRAWANAV